MRFCPLLVLLLACGPDDPIDLTVVPPDAAIDARPPDACVAEPTRGCCELLPDQSAVIGCITADLPPDSCGVVVCKQRDCTNVPVHYCSLPPSDAGTDAPPRSAE